MKKKLFLLAVVISTVINCFAQDISRADILATVEHIQRLSRDQETQLATALRNEKVKDDMIAWQAQQIDNFTVWGNQNEKAVKAIAEVLAIFVSIYLGSVLAGIVLKNFPSVEGWAVAPLCYALIFLATYYGVMTCIYAVSKYIPTVPIWHDVHAWVTHLHAPKLP